MVEVVDAVWTKDLAISPGPNLLSTNICKVQRLLRTLL